MSNLQNSPQKSAEKGFADVIKLPFKAINRQGRLLSYYAQAANTFKDKPYAERYRALFQLSVVYPKIYHVLSVFLALATDYLIADVLSDTSLQDQILRSVSVLLIACIFALLLLFVFIGIEYLKRMFSRSVFLAKSMQEDVKSIELTSLIGLMVLSIALSGVGGSFLTYTLADRTDVLKTEMQANLDSISLDYEIQIAAAKNAQQAYFEANNYKGVITYTKDGSIAKQYQTLTERVLEIEKQKPGALSNVRSEYRNQILSSSDNALLIGILAAFIILFLELSTLLAYNYQYKYLATVSHEGTQLQIIHPHLDTEIIQLTNQHARTPFVHSTLDVHEEEAYEKDNHIGFRWGRGLQTNNAPGGFHITCLECGKEAVKKVASAKFCSAKCRYAYNRKKIRASSQG